MVSQVLRLLPAMLVTQALLEGDALDRGRTAGQEVCSCPSIVIC